jgi:hypothetical protein
LEIQLAKSRQAYDALMSLSSSSISTISTTERTRKVLRDMTNNKIDLNGEDPIFAPVEKTHDLLNTMEYATRKCAQTIYNNNSNRKDSIVTKLEFIKQKAPISLDEKEQHVASWNLLARKHGVSVRQYSWGKYEGNVEVKNKLLPAAIYEEDKAEATYQICYNKLHEPRLTLSSRVPDQVIELLPHERL